MLLNGVRGPNDRESFGCFHKAIPRHSLFYGVFRQPLRVDRYDDGPRLGLVISLNRFDGKPHRVKREHIAR
jgi:hypothetical protein